MQIYNIHHREIAASVEQVGSLLDTLATSQDQLWPHDNWPRMRFDRPGLTEGGTGGHGPVGYRVEHFAPGRSVTFTFTNRPVGLVGRHQYLVQATGPSQCVLWHITNITPRGLLRLTWMPFWAPLHNALIEDSLDRAQFAATGVRTVSRWSPYVRALRALARLFVARPTGEKASAASGYST